MNTKSMLDTIGITLVIATFLLVCVAHPNPQLLSAQIEAETNRLKTSRSAVICNLNKVGQRIGSITKPCATIQAVNDSPSK